MKVINRSLILIKPKQAYADWAQGFMDGEPSLNLEEHRRDCTAYLVSEIEEDSDAEKIIREKYKEIFEHELSAWIVDESAWVKHRDLDTFFEWFDVEVHSIVVDLILMNQ